MINSLFFKTWGVRKIVIIATFLGGGGIVKYRLFDHSDDVVDHTHLAKTLKHLQ